MSTDDDCTDTLTAWEEIRPFAKALAPFAAMVVCFMLSWQLTESAAYTAVASAASAIICALSVFGPRRKVVVAWKILGLSAFHLTWITACVVVIGIGAWSAATAAGYYIPLLFSPFINHPYATLLGITFVLGVLSALAKHTSPSVQVVHIEVETGRTRKRWSIRVRRTIWERCHRKCYYCGCELDSWRGEHMHLEHVHPFSRGGADNEDNLVAACPPCNSEKGAKIYSELAQD